MDSDIIDAVTGWDSAPAEAGYAGLRSLADDGFTGAVVSDMAWGFFLNGRLLGVFDGAVDDFEETSFEAYSAPDPALPLLYAMRETGGDVRAQYYTEDTPLEDADGTLTAGGFTGYVELSENVLSGDYYVVYHGGKSMSAAFVGNSRRLVTGDDAFERASDEVGIYKVVDVDLDLVEIPEPTTADASDGTAAAAAADTDEATDDATTGEATDDATTGEATDDATTGEATDDATPAESTTADPAAEAAPAGESPGAETPADSTVSTEPDDFPTADSDPADAESAEARGSDATAADADADTESDPRADAPAADGPQTQATSARDPPSAEPPAESERAEASTGGGDPFSAEEQWRNARSIPALDPRDATGAADEDRPTGGSRSGRRKRPSRSTRSGGNGASPRRQSAAAESPPETPNPATGADDRLRSLREKLSRVESERDRLQAERDAVESERDEARARVAELEERVADLEAEVDRLESALDDAEVRPSETQLSPEEALRGTNLFVRYDRKGGATLAKAHDGEVKREDVVGNLRLEHHTTFDTEGLAVDGLPYEEFLHGTTEFGFARWVVTDLLYEIGETGNRSSLAGVFDAIPAVDRVELFGTVSIPLGDGESESRPFDVVFRDQMGDPLFVANMNDSRDPATQPMVTQLVKDSKAVAEAKESLGGAFVVTASFFEPEALEATTEATGGGFLSRSKRKSFVKLSRKQGYHLCLVEARNGEFHLNVPDL